MKSSNYLYAISLITGILTAASFITQIHIFDYRIAASDYRLVLPIGILLYATLIPYFMRYNISKETIKWTIGIIISWLLAFNSAVFVYKLAEGYDVWFFLYLAFLVGSLVGSVTSFSKLVTSSRSIARPEMFKLLIITSLITLITAVYVTFANNQIHNDFSLILLFVAWQLALTHFYMRAFEIIPIKSSKFDAHSYDKPKLHAQVDIMPKQAAVKVKSAPKSDMTKISDSNPESVRIADDLTKIHQLHVSGALTDEEYEKLKVAILEKLKSKKT